MINVQLFGPFSLHQEKEFEHCFAQYWQQVDQHSERKPDLIVCSEVAAEQGFLALKSEATDAKLVVWPKAFDSQSFQRWYELGAIAVLVPGLSDSATRQQLTGITQQVQRDIRLKQIYEQLLRSERLATIGQLAAGVAHEINNPIGFVSSNTSLVAKYLAEIEADLVRLATSCQQEESGVALLLHASWWGTSKIPNHITDLRELTEESLEGLQRVRAIINDLKGYTHSDEPVFEAADINSVLQGSLNLLRNEIKYKAELITHYGKVAKVDCIVSQIGQVFVNIIANACQAIEGFGTLTVKTQQAEGGVEISIADSGKGMTAEQQRRAFEPFYTTKPKGKGTGMGLSISVDIVQRHHGKITIVSELGTGTTFTLWLPFAQN